MLKYMMKRKQIDVECFQTPNTNSAKWHYHHDKDDIVEMWLADMDFAIFLQLKNKMLDVINNGDLGYAFIPDKYYDLTIDWLSQYHNSKLVHEQIIATMGTITTMCALVQEFSKVGDYVAYFIPSYHAFPSLIEDNGRKKLEIPLKENKEGYQIDFELVEFWIKRIKPKIFIFNNPHNPTGEVFGAEGLERLILLAKKYGFYIISDEIHMDFHFNATFLSMINYIECFEKIFVLTAPTKTFNIAGLKIANVIVSNTAIGQRVKNRLKKNGVKTPNMLGIVACMECYMNGQNWLKQISDIIQENLYYAREALLPYNDKIQLFKGEGTYFLWIKYKQNIKGEFAEQLLLHGDVRLEKGGEFGEEYKNYARLTLGCNKEVMKKGIEQIIKALEEINKC